MNKVAIYDPMILSWKIFEDKELVETMSLYKVKLLLEKEVNKDETRRS